MKKYTQEEFERLPIEDGYRICPTGDYTQVKDFGKRCSFGERCSFGRWCSFGRCCSFGERCSFGRWCSFGEWCSFSERCSFGEWCSFSERCSFGEGCKIENIYEMQDMFKAEGLGSAKRMTYLFLLTDGSILVRCGCFCGALTEFIDRAKETHGDSKYAQEYLMCAELAKLHFGG